LLTVGWVSRLVLPMKASRYTTRLIAFRNTHRLALRQMECVRDLILMDSARFSELPALEKSIAERAAYIQQIEAQIATAKAA